MNKDLLLDEIIKIPLVHYLNYIQAPGNILYHSNNTLHN